MPGFFITNYFVGKSCKALFLNKGGEDING